jgi:hypothetical protein
MQAGNGPKERVFTNNGQGYIQANNGHKKGCSVFAEDNGQAYTDNGQQWADGREQSPQKR